MTLDDISQSQPLSVSSTSVLKLKTLSSVIFFGGMLLGTLKIFISGVIVNMFALSAIGHGFEPQPGDSSMV